MSNGKIFSTKKERKKEPAKKPLLTAYLALKKDSEVKIRLKDQESKMATSTDAGKPPCEKNYYARFCGGFGFTKEGNFRYARKTWFYM